MQLFILTYFCETIEIKHTLIVLGSITLIKIANNIFSYIYIPCPANVCYDFIIHIDMIYFIQVYTH